MSIETLDYDLSELEQVIVLGGGIEGNSAAFPGTILHDSEYSRSSYERAVRAGHFAEEHPSVDTVLFCGRTPFMMPEQEDPGTTVARAMEMVATAINPELQEKSFRGAGSQTTVWNFLEVAREKRTTVDDEGYLTTWIEEGRPETVIDPNKPVGVVTDSLHFKRARKIGKFVMPRTEFVLIPSEDPDQPEAGPSRAHELISNALFHISMLGVTPGDLDKIEKRDIMTQKSIQTIKKVGRGMLKVLHTGAASQQLAQAA